MTTWTYDLHVPNDAQARDLETLRQLAIATWRTSVETLGGRPAEATATLTFRDSSAADGSDAAYVDRETSLWTWHVVGEVN